MRGRLLLAVLLAVVLTGCSEPGSGGSEPVSTATVRSVPASPTPSASAAEPSPTRSCDVPEPTAVDRVRLGSTRLVDGVRLTSDGSRLTRSTLARAAFAPPELVREGRVVTDAGLLRAVANLLARADAEPSGTTDPRPVVVTLTLTRPAPPDRGLTEGAPPFDAIGRFVAFGTAREVSARVILTCGTEEQVATLTGWADATTGLVSCATEPPASPSSLRLAHDRWC